MLLLIAAIVGLAALLGAVLIVLGVRGRRVDRHPRCRRCGYDLSGSAAVPDVCPECGRELGSEPATMRRRLRIGNRRKRPALIAAGLFLVVVPVGVGGIYLYNETRDFDWITIKPLWWLMRDAQQPSPAGTLDRRELVRRVEDGELSDAQLADVADLALRIQADPSIPWEGDWGRIIEHLWSNDQLTQQQIEQYVQRAFDVNFRVEARPRIRAGAKLPMAWGVRQRAATPGIDAWRLSHRRIGGRLPGGTQETLRVLADAVKIAVDGEAVRASLQDSDYTMIQAGAYSYPNLEIDLKPGSHEITFTFHCTAWEEPPGQRRRYVNDRLELPEDIITHWTIEHTVNVEVVAADESIIELVDDPSLATAVRNSIVQVEFIQRQIPYPVTPTSTKRGTFGGRHGMIIIDTPPIDLSFDVFARVGDREHRIGGITATTAEGLQNAIQIDVHPATVFPDADTIDLILRSSPAPAELTMDITRVWRGEIIVGDVPIRAAAAEEE